MSKRAVLAGLLGGIAMFVWSSVAHTVLPLGEVGIQEIANEQQVLAAVHSSLGTTPGFYLFPAVGVGPNATRAQRDAAMAQYGDKLAANPSGLLIYHPPGAKALTPRKLLTEFLTELLEALLAVWLLSQTRLAGFAARAGFVTVVGIAAAITTNLPYWNWYGFPGNYTAAYMSVELIGYLCVGLVAGALMKTAAPRTSAAAA